MLEMNSDHEVILVWLILPRINKSESPVTKKSTLPSMERLSKKVSFYLCKCLFLSPLLLILQMLQFDLKVH